MTSIVIRAASRADGGRSGTKGGRRVYKQSQSQPSISAPPIKEIASFVIPAGVFVAVTFGIASVDSSLFLYVCVYTYVSIYGHIVYVYKEYKEYKT